MSGLLEGLRVVEIATFVFVPGAGTVLSDFGAEVIHVEPPGIGDPYRVSPSDETTARERYELLLGSRQP